jgi:hypothetical protein
LEGKIRKGHILFDGFIALVPSPKFSRFIHVEREKVGSDIARRYTHGRSFGIRWRISRNGARRVAPTCRSGNSFPLLKMKLRGYYIYYGVPGNSYGLREFYEPSMKILWKWG